MRTMMGVNLSDKCADRLGVTMAMSSGLLAVGWQDITSAPKDGAEIELRVVHVNAAFAENPAAEGWVDHCRGKWIDHNGGGWTWNGMCGRPCQWRPIQEVLT